MNQLSLCVYLIESGLVSYATLRYLGNIGTVDAVVTRRQFRRLVCAITTFFDTNSEAITVATAAACVGVGARDDSGRCNEAVAVVR